MVPKLCMKYWEPPLSQHYANFSGWTGDSETLHDSWGVGEIPIELMGWRVAQSNVRKCGVSRNFVSNPSLRNEQCTCEQADQDTNWLLSIFYVYQFYLLFLLLFSFGEAKKKIRMKLIPANLEFGLWMNNTFVMFIF